MAQGERHSERYLRAIIEHLRAVELKEFDRGELQGVVDYVSTFQAAVRPSS